MSSTEKPQKHQKIWTQTQPYSPHRTDIQQTRRNSSPITLFFHQKITPTSESRSSRRSTLHWTSNRIHHSIQLESAVQPSEGIVKLWVETRMLVKWQEMGRYGLVNKIKLTSTNKISKFRIVWMISIQITMSNIHQQCQMGDFLAIKPISRPKVASWQLKATRTTSSIVDTNQKSRINGSLRATTNNTAMTHSFTRSTKAKNI